MEKKRVQDVAKELGIKTKKLIEFLEEWAPRDDEKKWTNFHILDDEHIEMIYQEFGEPQSEKKETAVAVEEKKEEKEEKKAEVSEEEEEIKVEEKPIEEVVAEVLGKEVREEKPKEETRPPKPERRPRPERRRPVREFRKPPKGEVKPKEPPKPVEQKKEEKKPQPKEEKKKEKLSKEEQQILKKLQQQMEREKKKEERRQQEKKKEDEIKIIEIYEGITVRELADLLGVPANKVIGELMKRGILATINQAVPTDVAIEVAESFGFLAEAKKEEEEETLIEEIPDKPEDLKPRPPIVVVMGHVDHGKTTLLDTIRKTNVAEREKGGITQHIGAYQVKLPDGRIITFLDTPGHEAFTTLRARGAQITDIAVLVVAADDGVMPQTIEAINHAKAFNVPIIVAVNKIDKPGADPMKVRRELSEHGLIPEEWGGDTIFVDVSAKTGQNVEQLLEMINLLADILELKANPNKRAKGVIIETKLDRKKGPTATVIIQEGTLRVGDTFVAGITHGRVRAMFDDKGRQVKEATPSTPVEVLGFEDLPEAGDTLVVVDSERKAREIAEKIREKREKEEKLAQSVRLEDIYKKIQSGETKELLLIIKADTMGSLEALKKSLEELSTDKVAVRVIHGAVGGITENDVMLAKASGAIIIGFNTRPDPKARELIEKEKVDARMYGIIYQVIDDVKKALQGLLEPVEREEVLGSAEVRATFKVKKVGTVAGCYVLEGKMVRGAKARLIREGVVVYDGEIENLKRFKEDVQEVAKGYECGIKLKDFNDVKVGDIIECYEIKLEQPTL
ncbi:MAG: translation initiation factor IF-2 [Aquificae bacterium]|nr:translation initiation factor IF-2 [Aquificota bacterium]